MKSEQTATIRGIVARHGTNIRVAVASKRNDEAKDKVNLVSPSLQQAQLEWDKFCEDYRHGSVSTARRG